MSKSLRFSEKWFHRALWLVAFAFAFFLTGLGSAVIGDLPKIEGPLELDRYVDRPAFEAQQAEALKEQLERAQLQLQALQNDTRACRETLSNWLATRHATKRPEQDLELLQRTREQDRLKDRERKAQAEAEEQEAQLLENRQALAKAEKRLSEIRAVGQERMDQEARRIELRVFAYRLMLVLPILLSALWLLKVRRKASYWPFVWGYALFALFTFFVELVPYLPSYGGYVRHGVGIALTVAVGWQAIKALRRYLDRQKQAEGKSEVERRGALSYDIVLGRLTKGVCPGCERVIDSKSTAIDYCPHCGLHLHGACQQCQTRKSTFAPYCHVCGAHDGAMATQT